MNRRYSPGVTVRTVVVLIVLGIVVLPLYWMFVTATTRKADMFGDTAQWWPDLTHLDAFQNVLSNGQVPIWIFNSLLVATGTTLISVMLAVPLGYALSRYKFRGRGSVQLLLLLTQMLPEALLVIPIFAIFKSLGLLNSQLGLILIDAALVLPIVALIIKGAIDGIPIEIEEAARTDGANPFRILWGIILPLIGPTVAAGAVIAFFSGWNEYLFAVTFTIDASVQPASVGLAGFIGELTTPLDSVMAVALMYTLPAIAFYFFTQRYVVAGVTAGGVKG